MLSKVMMLLVMGLAVLLRSCAWEVTDMGNGVYVGRPVTLQPTYPYEEPTPEVIPTATPCTLSVTVPDYVNMRVLPTTAAEIKTRFPDTAAPISGYWRETDSSMIWWQVWWSDNAIPYAGYLWVANVSAVVVTGECSALAYVNPF